MKIIIEAKVVEVADLNDPKNPNLKWTVVLESQKRITPTLTAPDFVKAKSFVKPSKAGEVLRFEAEVINIAEPGGRGVKTYYRILKEVK